jgi:nitrous oxidase accessory protein
VNQPTAAGASAEPTIQDTQSDGWVIPDWLSLSRVPLLGPLIVVGGAALLVVAGTLPVWGTRLIAPQYPRGLELWFYGGRVEGPVREVNALNHYIGMRPIDLSIVPEMALWPLAIVGSALLLSFAVLWRGWLGRLALIGLWLVPVTVLVDIQRWLYIFGHDLDPTAALRLDPFVPWVVGPSTVWNFTVWNFPGMALILIWVVALAATVARRAPQVDRRTGLLAGAAALLIAGAGTIAVVLPAVAPDDATGVRPAPPAAAATARSAQALIDAAEPGSTVRLAAGTYHERLLIDKPLTITADGEVLIYGGGRGSVITITASDVTLRGVRVAGSGGQGEDGAGIKVVEADRVVLDGLHVSEAFTGITVMRGKSVHIVGVEIAGAGQSLADAGHAMDSGHGGHAPATDTTDPHADHGRGAGPQGQGDAIHLWAVKGALLRDNHIHDVRDGIYLNYADEVLADSNRISASRYAVHSMFGSQLTFFGNELRDNLSGLVFMYSHDVLAGRNVIADHRSAGTGVGVIVKDVVGLRLAENVIARNRVGLRAEGTAHTADAKAEVLRNRFAANSIGVWLVPSANIGFGANAFDGNLTTVLAQDHGIERRNQWTYQGTGNFWSDYGGYDLAGDGQGDIAHVSYGAAHALMAAAPALELYVTSPAFHVFARAQQMWAASRQPMVHDSAPLTIDPAPTMPIAPADGGRAPWLAAGAGLLFFGLGGHLLRSVRLPSRRLQPSLDRQP